MGIVGNLAVEMARNEPRLHLEQAAHRDPLAEQRMSDLLVEPSLVSRDDGLARVRLEVHRRPRGHEAVRLHLAVVDRLDHSRVGEDRPERLHHVERKRGTAEARMMVEAEIGIKADGRKHGDQVRASSV